MKETPILMSGPMVRAILDGPKTQTRRVARDVLGTDGFVKHLDICPYGVPGDRLWVRETLIMRDAAWLYHADGSRVKVDRAHLEEMEHWDKRMSRDYCPSIHMPRWASRITLEITDVRVQRLQEISAADALEEGAMQSSTWDSDAHKAFQKQMDGLPFTDEQVAAMSDIEYHAAVEQTWKNYAVSGFAALWDSINGKTYPWASNPRVRALTFRRRCDEHC